MIDHTELFDALDELLAAAQELRRQRRALFPALRRDRKARARVLACWRAMKGEVQLPPDEDRPILDAIDRAPLRKDEGGRMKDESISDRPSGLTHPSSLIPHPSVEEDVPDPAELVTVEELPDGSPPARSKGRKRKPAAWVECPGEAWTGESLYAAARRIAGKTERSSLTATETALTVLCNRCNAARHRTAGACPQCRCPEYRTYGAALLEVLAPGQSPAAGMSDGPSPEDADTLRDESRKRLLEALTESETDRYSWDILRRGGATDGEIAENLRLIWGGGHRVKKRAHYTTRGAPTPAFWSPKCSRLSDPPTFAGATLIEEIRFALHIPTPERVPVPMDDDPLALARAPKRTRKRKEASDESPRA